MGNRTRGAHSNSVPEKWRMSKVLHCGLENSNQRLILNFCSTILGLGVQGIQYSSSGGGETETVH